MPTNDDDFVASVVSIRMQRGASTALGLGAGGLAVSAVPHSGALLPIVVYGACAVLPVVFGVVALVGVVSTRRIPTGETPAVQEALSRRKTGGPTLVAAGVLGGLSLVSGLAALVFMALA